jgi:adenosylcobyric acid synthase
LPERTHGVFDNDAFRGDYFKAINPSYRGFLYSDYREQAIQGFANSVAEHLDVNAILKALHMAY